MRRGVMASARWTAPPPEMVQFAKYSGAVSPLSVTLPTAPTPGNLLVVVVRDVKTFGAQYTYSHPLTQHEENNIGAWAVTIASGLVQPGASATVSVQAFSASNDALAVLEIANVNTFVGAAKVHGGNYGLTTTVPAFIGGQPGDLGVTIVGLGSTANTPTGVTFTHGVVAGTAQGLMVGYTLTPWEANPVSWLSPNTNEKIPLIGVFR